jgi:hypothetical protein
MRARRLVSVAISVAVAAVISGCGPPKRIPIVGAYKHVHSLPKATLVLRADKTYEFCAVGSPCETGTYDLDLTMGPDYCCDRISFSGEQMYQFTGGGVVNADYSWGSVGLYYGDPDNGPDFEKND